MDYGLCSLIGGNTGSLICDAQRGNPQAFTIGGKVFAPADYIDEETFIAAFTTAINQSNGVADKLFPFTTILGTDDQTDAAKYGTSGYGVKFFLLDERPAFQFQMSAGASLVKNYKKWNGKNVPVFVHDDNDLTWARVDKSGNISGCMCTIGITSGSFGDAKDKKFVLITISYLDSTDFSTGAKAIPSSFSSTDLSGLYDVVFSEQAAHTANVYHINASIPNVIAGGDINVIAGADGTAFATAANFQAFTGAGYATSLAITTVAPSSNGKYADVTLDSTAFTALASGAKIKLQTIGTAGLITAGVSRLDPGFIILTK